VIQAEKGVPNLKHIMFNKGVSSHAQAPVEQQGVDTFAKTLEQKVERRVAEKHEEPKDIEKKPLFENRNDKPMEESHNRTPKEKVNKDKDVESIKDRIKKLKKALNESGEEIPIELENLISELEVLEAIPQELMVSLETLVENFVEMENVELDKPVLEVVQQLPEELKTQVSELLSEVKVMDSQTPDVEPLKESEEAEPFQVKLESVMESIDQTIDAIQSEGSEEVDKDLVKVLNHIKEVLGEAVNKDSEQNEETSVKLRGLEKAFNMVESMGVKENKPALNKLQELMNQQKAPVEVKVESRPTTDGNNLDFSSQKETGPGMAEVKPLDTDIKLEDAEVKVEVKGEVADKTPTKTNVESDTPKTNVQKTETTLVVEQTVDQLVEVKETIEVSKIQTTQVAKVHQNILNQVLDAAKMSFNLEDETSEMLIKLKPNSMGNVELKVSIEKGVLLAEFNVESQIVKEALESNLADLRNALSDKGFSIHDLNVSVNQEQANQQQQHPRQRFVRQQNRIELQTAEHLFERASLESYNTASTIDFLG